MSSPLPRKGMHFSLFSFSLVAAVFLVLSTSVAVGVALQLHQRSYLAGDFNSSLTPRYLVMLVLDGAEPSYVHAARLPHLDALRSQGIEYDRAWAGILESETPAGHATLSTGSSPGRNGILGFNWIKSDSSAVRLFDPNIVRQGAMEKVMQVAGAPTIASLFKARNPRAKVLAVSGHKYYAADPLGGPVADYILYYAPDAQNHYVPTAIPGHVPPASVMSGPGLTTNSTILKPGVENRLAVKLAMNSFKQVRQQITLINLPEFDWPLGHVNGGDPAAVKTLMTSFDRDLGYIEDTYRKAGVLDRTLFVVTADHGMAPLKFQIPDSVMDDAVTRAGTTSPETTYSTAGYIWLQAPALAQAVANNVVAARNPHIQSVYYKVTATGGDSYVLAGNQSISASVNNANQSLLKSFLGGNAPDVVAFCTEHAAFAKQGAESWKGNHGGAAWESQHMPLIIAGPGVRPGVLSHTPARLEDIAPTVLAMMGVRSTGMEGIVLADAMQSPTGQEQKTQQLISGSLAPIVSALATQSHQEVVGQGQ